jgi:hypothetical protein
MTFRALWARLLSEIAWFNPQTSMERHNGRRNERCWKTIKRSEEMEHQAKGYNREKFEVVGKGTSDEKRR